MPPRKHSKKRDAIYECVRSTKTHPSAEWVYSRLKPEIPDLSLGTVYRNLAMFKQEGDIISVGTVGGLEHPGWQENLANALKLQALLNRAYPGLCRNLDLRTERFNQHETSGSLLAEFGSTGNTLREAIRAGRCFAEGLSELILCLT